MSFADSADGASCSSMSVGELTASGGVAEADDTPRRLTTPGEKLQGYSYIRSSPDERLRRGLYYNRKEYNGGVACTYCSVL